MIMKAAVGEWCSSSPVNDTLEATLAPSFRKSNLWPVRSSWICTSDQGILLPNTTEKADGYAERRSLGLVILPFSDTQIHCIFTETFTQADMCSQKCMLV